VNVALMTEGTYPHNFGGVSVWCDQLVRGMSGYDFQVVALVATGTEQPTWELPDNITSVVTVPMWGVSAAGRAPGRQARQRFEPLLRELIRVLLDTSPELQPGFEYVLRELFEYAQRENLRASISSEHSVRMLVDAWRHTSPVTPTLHDALTALHLLEHALRPLSHPPVRADVLHAATNGLGVLPAITSRWRNGTPLVVTEHGIYLREQYLNGRRSPYRWPVKSLYMTFLRRLCALGYHEAAMITPGNVYNRRWENRLGAENDSIRTVYNGVDPADFPALDTEPELPTLVWAGRIDPIKDLETLLRAFQLVRLEIPAARLRIFGTPPKGRESYLTRCQALATELGINAAATFDGRIPRIRDAYAAGNVVVLSSISEGFPYTLIEAMTCGRPCVATDVGGVTEAVGDTGLVVPPREPAMLAKACVALLRDTDLRHRLGAAARIRALEMFTVDRAITTFDEIYSFLGTGRPLPTADDLPVIHLAPEREVVS
jgi:glycosyltransferase involved in cell wall biosynthesis